MHLVRTSDPSGPADRSSADRLTVVPVTRGDRPVGAYVVGPDTARFLPVLDVSRLAALGLAALAIGLAAPVVVAGLRRPSAIGTVTMGPGGWISLRNAGTPPLAARTPRPWWARALRAHRLVVQR